MGKATLADWLHREPCWEEFLKDYGLFLIGGEIQTMEYPWVYLATITEILLVSDGVAVSATNVRRTPSSHTASRDKSEWEPCEEGTKYYSFVYPCAPVDISTANGPRRFHFVAPPNVTLYPRG